MDDVDRRAAGAPEAPPAPPAPGPPGVGGPGMDRPRHSPETGKSWGIGRLGWRRRREEEGLDRIRRAPDGTRELILYQRRPWLSFESRVGWLAFFVGVPGGLTALILLFTGDFSGKTKWTLAIFIVLLWLVLAAVLRERVVRPIQTLSNLLGALREGDYSIRARGARPDDALGLGFLEVNALGETLREQRLGAKEAAALLDKVMAEIDVAVFTFDGERRLRLVNRAGERLLARSGGSLLGRTASDLGLERFLHGGAHRTVEIAFPGGEGRWELRRTTFRQEGLPHQLLVLSDLSRALRAEERGAWQRLIRVLGHEINNSLAPIHSIAGSLQTLTARRPPEWEQDVESGLAVIATRAKSLSRFMQSYARLAKLPRPEPAPLSVPEWVRSAAELETRKPIRIAEGPDIVISADGDQLEQVLINLLRNAVDATLESGGEVAVGWRVLDEDEVEVWVEDEGPGIRDTANLFVPFFTTKPEGSGIGLALSRQIIEAHGGTLTLENRTDRLGARARIRVPVSAGGEVDPRSG